MILDLVVIGILLASALVAFWRGLVREVLTIFSLIGAAGATFLFGPDMAKISRGWLVDDNATEKQRFFDLIPYDVVGTAIGFAIVFMGVLLTLTFVAHWFSRALHAVGLGPVDRSLGVVFGLVRGVVLVGLMSVVLNFIVSEAKREDYFGDSKTYPYVAYLAELGEAMMPGKEAVSKEQLKDTLGVVKGVAKAANDTAPASGAGAVGAAIGGAAIGGALDNQNKAPVNLGVQPNQNAGQLNE